MTDTSYEYTFDRTIQELHFAFEHINRHLFENSLPKPAILVQTQGRRTKNILGWCTADQIWQSEDHSITKYEITITAEYLNRELYQLLGTLLHEMVHLYCQYNDIKDTSRGGNYHNKKFKQEAEKRGLYCEFSKSRGWSETSPGTELIGLLNSFPLDPEVFLLKRHTWAEKPEEDKKKKKKKKVKSQWACKKCYSLIVDSVDKINLICGDCMQAFELLDDDQETDSDNQEIDKNGETLDVYGIDDNVETMS